MMEEIWKAIEGYEGLYQVSNLGRVRSLGRTIQRRTRWGTTADYSVEGKILKILSSSYNACYVHLFDMNGKSTNHKVHRLVAQAFIPNPNNLSDVNHKDENRKNNNVENLEWMSHVDNCNYGTRNERSKTKRSKPVQQLDADENVVAEYPSTIEAERVTGTSRYQIRMCCNGKYKTAGGYRWKFKEQ